MVTCPSAVSTTLLSLRTHSTVVPCICSLLWLVDIQRLYSGASEIEQPDANGYKRNAGRLRGSASERGARVIARSARMFKMYAEVRPAKLNPTANRQDRRIGSERTENPQNFGSGHST